MTPDARTPRYTRTPHLVGLVGETERLAALIENAPVEAVTAVADGLRARAAVATLRLDGSPIEGPPDLGATGTEVRDDATTQRPRDRAPRGTTGSWFEAMDAHEHEDRVLALEYLGARAAADSDDVSERLLTDPQAALTTLHRRLTRGLLDDGHAGRPRATDQAVHDASTGRIIYYAPDPADVPARLAMLSTWIQTTGAREHALVVSGVLHLDLLHLHPFEAANGRLARAAARLALRARGLDPHGLAGPEIALTEDPIGYYEDVAATQRRRDLTIWLERWGEAVSAGLRIAASTLGLLDPDVPVRAERFLESCPDSGFTIADYRAGATVGPQQARTDIEALLDANLIKRRPGSRGLRFTVASDTG